MVKSYSVIDLVLDSIFGIGRRQDRLVTRNGGKLSRGTQGLSLGCVSVDTCQAIVVYHCRICWDIGW